MTMDGVLKEAIELAKMRVKDKEGYENLMANLFNVHTDFMVFERELDKTYRKFEEAWKVEDR